MRVGVTMTRENDNSKENSNESISLQVTADGEGQTTEAFALLDGETDSIAMECWCPLRTRPRPSGQYMGICETHSFPWDLVSVEKNWNNPYTSVDIPVFSVNLAKTWMMGTRTSSVRYPSSGPYAPGCVDVMSGYSKEGLFARIYYPTAQTNIKEHSSRWIPWLPHEKYVIGFAYILKLWTFLIRLLVKYVAGDIQIPIIKNESVNRNIGKLKTIVFSHGLGGTRFLYSNTCCELASHGFVVIALEHRDGTASMTYYYESKEKVMRNEPTWFRVKRVKVGGPEHFPLRKEQVEKRSSECKRALDLLENLNDGVDIGNILETDFDFTQFKGLLDFSETVMMGHSFGGATSLLTLGTDPRFKVGVILDPWMFSIKSHKGLADSIHQPLLFINTQTFHIIPNLKELEKYTAQKNRETYTIRQTTHENQSDTVHVIGYWLNIFMRKINREVASMINNCLILRFLEKHVTFRNPTNAAKYLTTQSRYIVEDIAIEGVYNKPKRIPEIW